MKHTTPANRARPAAVETLERRQLMSTSMPVQSFNGGQVLKGDAAETADAVVLQADGKVVSARTGASGDVSLVRHGADGKPDASFDGDGRATLARGGNQKAFDLVQQKDGKLVVAMTEPDGSNPGRAKFVLARYNANGSLDASFTGDGTATATFDGTLQGAALLLRGNGRLIAVGTADFTNPLTGAADRAVALAAFRVDGSAHGGFGTNEDGRELAEFVAGDAGFDTARAATLGKDNSIYVAGSRAGTPAVARFNPDGTLSDWRNDGVTTIQGPASKGELTGIGRDPVTRKLYVAGTATMDNGGGGVTHASFVAGLLPNGERDTAFGETGSGYRLVEIGTSSSGGFTSTPSRISSLAVAGDRIVIAGADVESSSARFGINWHHAKDGYYDTGYQTNLTMTSNNLAEGAADVFVDRHGRVAVAANYVGADGQPRPAVARFEGRAVPVAPTTPVKVADVKANGAALSWKDQSTSETRYEVEYTDNGTWSWAAKLTLGADANNVTLKGLIPNKQYFARVRAVNEVAAGNVSYGTWAPASFKTTNEKVARRIDAGENGMYGSYVDSTGRAWESDHGYSGGIFSTGVYNVEGTSDDALYAKVHKGAAFSYAVPVVNGTYTLKLHFADGQSTSAGQRRFDVGVEGSKKLSNFDVYAEAGGARRALVKTFSNVAINDGALNLSFTGTHGDAVVSAIELVPV